MQLIDVVISLLRSPATYDIVMSTVGRITKDQLLKLLEDTPYKTVARLLTAKADDTTAIKTILEEEGIDSSELIKMLEQLK